ncbi:aminotransferase class I/II-fold pyridoxal phosphate-dependent enzyme [Herpetosiphon giganteus]|uniref:aminotransferase class I/II-fold pyridoxal phosphate-dependent enzyme n=1 Tax=Herpetosiphon giganteus TaxID=2029754 RepID=UPI001958C047|nr:aminotransferase class I/II-fold pyridoxal phosphate-dependent enzyme [Herpetosiphon giganteus]MBM7843301.1 aminotransferase [Herpetosiphon giganteus]
MTRERLSARVQSVPPSGIRRFFDIAATMENVISLGIGEPDFVTPYTITQAGIRSLQQGKTAYTSNSGTIELRQELQKHLNQLYGINYDPENELLITVGVSEALQNAMLATIDPGDEVIIPEPCFVAYGPSVVFAGGFPVYVSTSVEQEFQVTREAIEAAITPKTKAILIGYPNNPTGAVMSRERLLDIAALAEQYDLLVFSDEIYDRLVYGVEHTSFAQLPGMRERTILLGGFSKAYAMTGWRLGWLAASAEIANAVRKIHQYAIMSAPTVAQYAGLAALQTGEEDVQRMVSEYDRRRQVIVAGLRQIGLPTFEPQGAFYVFPQVSSLGLTSEAFVEGLLYNEKVAVVPGDAFGPSGAGFVRMCYATSMDNIETALERIERYVRSL